MGRGCPSGAGETLLEIALYPPRPIGKLASAIKCSLPRLSDGVRERAVCASWPGERLRGELLYPPRPIRTAGLGDGTRSRLEFAGEFDPLYPPRPMIVEVRAVCGVGVCVVGNVGMELGMCGLAI